MKRIIGAGVAGLAVLGAVAAGAGSAFAAPPPQSGNVHGTVTVETALTLQLVGTSFTVNGAIPGVTDNGVPATVATISTNDSTGYALSTYMDDTPLLGPGAAPVCDAFAFQGAGNSFIPDTSWTDTSTGGPGASGAPQTYAGYAPFALGNGVGNPCTAPAAQAMTVGQSNTESVAAGDVFTEQLAVDVPANTPGGVTFSGDLTYLATGA